MDAVSKIRKIQEMQKVLGDESPELTAELKSILRETVMEELQDPNYPVGETVVTDSQQEGELVVAFDVPSSLPPEAAAAVKPRPRKGRSIKMATGPYFTIDLESDRSQSKILKHVKDNPHASVEGMEEIADVIGVHETTVSPTVSRLRAGGFLGGTVHDLVFLSATGRHITRRKTSANLILAGRITEALQTYGASSAESLIEHLECSSASFYRAIRHLLIKGAVTKMGKLYCLVEAK